MNEEIKTILRDVIYCLSLLPLVVELIEAIINKIKERKGKK